MDVIELEYDGPVAIVVDNGWSAAAHWADRARLIDSLIDDHKLYRSPGAADGLDEDRLIDAATDFILRYTTGRVD